MYIGNTPAENYASFLTETFTVSATASYTLSHAVTNENDMGSQEEMIQEEAPVAEETMPTGLMARRA